MAAEFTETWRTWFSSLAAVAYLSGSMAPETAVAARVFHIAPDADAGAPLSDSEDRDQMAITLTQAIALLRDPKLRDSEGALTDDVYLYLRPGTYRLDAPIIIDESRGGSPKYRIVLQGPQDASAIISGGRSITGFAPVTSPFMLARLSPEAQKHVLQVSLLEKGVTDFGVHRRRGFGQSGVPAPLELFYRNQPMTLARWPNAGFARITAVPDRNKGRSFGVDGARLETWIEDRDIMAVGYWSNYWADSTLSITGIELSTRLLTLADPGPPFGMRVGQPVYFNNTFAELDRPGEWYLDRASGTLYFWPPQGFNRAADSVDVSLVDRLLVIDGASNIRIAGITFETARGDAITIHGGTHNSILNSVIRNIGSRAVVISSQHSGISDVLIENTGEAGVVISGGDRQSLRPAGIYVEKTTIRRFGRLTRTYQPGIRLAGVGNRAVGNKIHDAPHAAILFGGNDHLIARNEIFDVCKESGDSGAIYTGRDWSARGTVIAENFIHDVAPNVSFGRTRGVYLDDYASGTIIRGNRFERVLDAIFINGGRDNLVESNTFSEVDSYIRLSVPHGDWAQVPSNMKTYMKERLRAVPYDRSPYKERYPNLANILEDDPGSPKYNIARGNRIIGNARFVSHENSVGGIKFEQSAAP